MVEKFDDICILLDTHHNVDRRTEKIRPN